MDAATHHLDAFLKALGHAGDPEMTETARRFAELLADFVPGPVDPPSTCAVSHPTPVVLRGLRFHSLCAHHLLPFFGTVAVGYRPKEVLLGLGSVPRLVRAYARRPQLQERLGEQLADALFEAARPEGVVVVVRARHLCVEMRGAEAEADVVTLAVRGDPGPWLIDQVSAPAGRAGPATSA